MPQKKIGRGGGSHHAGQDRPSRNGPERDQGARGNTRGGPEDDLRGRNQKTVAQLCRHEIGYTDHGSDPDAADPCR